MIKIQNRQIVTDASTAFEFLESPVRLSVVGTFIVYRKLKNGKFAVCSKYQHKKALKSILVAAALRAEKMINGN